MKKLLLLPVILISIGCTKTTLERNTVITLGTVDTVAMMYDTVDLTGGSGFHDYSFPKFDTLRGHLSRIKITSIVSVMYGLNMTNQADTPVIYDITFIRYDEIQAPVLSIPLTFTYEKPYATFSFTGKTTQSQPLATMLYSDTVINQLYDSSQISSFIGTGNVDYLYDNFTSYSVTGGYQYAATQQAGDIINFSITYYYTNK